MATAIVRVPVFNVNRESLVWWLWSNWNTFLKHLDGHVHSGVLAGAANTTAHTLGGGVLRMAGLGGRGYDGVTVAAGPGGGPTLAVLTERDSTLLAALVKSYNVAISELENHVHGGVTAGAVNTAGVNLAGGGDVDVAKTGVIADLQGRDPAGAIKAASGSIPVRQIQAVWGLGGSSDLRQMALNINAFITAENNHTHQAAAGAVATAPFAFTTAVSRVVDMNGRDAHGELLA